MTDPDVPGPSDPYLREHLHWYKYIYIYILIPLILFTLYRTEARKELSP